MEHEFLSKNKSEEKKSPFEHAKAVLEKRKKPPLNLRKAVRLGLAASLLAGADGFTIKQTLAPRVRHNLKFGIDKNSPNTKEISPLRIHAKEELKTISRDNIILKEHKNDFEDSWLEEFKFISKQPENRFEITEKEAGEIFGTWLLEKNEVEEYRQKINYAIKLKREGMDVDALTVFNIIENDLTGDCLQKKVRQDIETLAEIKLQIMKREANVSPEFASITLDDLKKVEESRVVFMSFYALEEKERKSYLSKEEHRKATFFDEDRVFQKATKEEELNYLEKSHTLCSNVYNIFKYTIPEIEKNFELKGNAKD
jgi:hypothetical protein